MILEIFSYICNCNPKRKARHNLLILKQKSPTDLVEDILTYRPIQDVAPSAVRIADAIDAINCTINLVVSFLLITIQILVFTV